MAIDATSPRSRIALLAAAVGGAAAAAATSVARSGPVAGADSVFLETVNVSTATTTVHYTGGSTITAFKGKAGPGFGLTGETNSGIGVLGTAGVNGIGISAVSGNGPALKGTSQWGFGLDVVKGRARFHEISGVATIKKGKKNVTVTPGVPINGKTFVLLTPMANIGSRALWFTKRTAVNKFVIRMSSTRAAPTKVAWLTLERGEQEPGTEAHCGAFGEPLRRLLQLRCAGTRFPSSPPPSDSGTRWSAVSGSPAEGGDPHQAQTSAPASNSRRARWYAGP